MTFANVRVLVSEKLNNLDSEQVAYLLSFLFFLLMLPLSKVTDFPVYWLSFGSCICGLSFYLIEATEKVMNNFLGKTIASIAIIGGTTFNLAMAQSFVNHALEVPVTPFGYTVTISSILAIPYTGSIFLAFGFTFWFLLILLTSFLQIELLSLQNLAGFSEIKKLFNDNPFTLFGRMFGVIVLFSVALSFLGDNKGYMDATSNFTRWFAYNLEMEQFSYCDVDEKQKVAYLGSNKIIIGKEHEGVYTFSVRDCETGL
ncbi:hypothetical protein [Photobacterium leiognathi]|uniref:hypothetical protein n=1 Tax=Photobacterium leiognathi TaxID=553611 RepID=UPI002981C71F|nr:hypothetical protein [Photobacterium leiognathi]